jgi:hypothetical protein
MWRESLVQAVRATPLRGRAEAMLDVLAAALPDGEGEALLRSLRQTDSLLAPTAVSVLVRRDLLRPEEVSDQEAPRMAAEGLLQLLENLGEERCVDLLLAEGAEHARAALGAALASDHPDRDGLDRLRRPAEGPLRERSAQLDRLNAARARPIGKRRARTSALITSPQIRWTLR